MFLCLSQHYVRHTIYCVRSEKIAQYIVFQLLTLAVDYYTIVFHRHCNIRLLAEVQNHHKSEIYGGLKCIK